MMIIKIYIYYYLTLLTPWENIQFYRLVYAFVFFYNMKTAQCHDELNDGTIYMYIYIIFKNYTTNDRGIL